MHRKFARFDYVNNINEIPVRFNVVKNDLENKLDWYIGRYNPFSVFELNVADEEGFRVVLPLTEEESFADNKKATALLLRTITALKDYNVEIVLPPFNLSIPINDNTPKMNIADGTRLFPYFLPDALKKVLKNIRKDISMCDVVVINGNYNLAESVLDNIYDNLNFLTVVDLNKNSYELDEKAEAFRADSGLNLMVYGKNKTVLKTADIIINTAEGCSDFDYAFKKNAVYFDLSTVKHRRKELINRRGDITVVDGLILNYKNTLIPLELFELAFYLKSREYRYITAKNYNTLTGANLRSSIERMNIKVSSFSQLGRTLTGNNTVIKPKIFQPF